MVTVLVLEVSIYEEAKIATESPELKFKDDKVAHASDLADPKKQEDSLKQDAKIVADTKLAEARSVMKNAQKKFMEAEENMMENVTNGWKLSVSIIFAL
ncbi:Hypothetical predicted protein [Olea europaea subsp. europaea]|uniref:Uncharacterized protein n=1 Tax=Olea europaea subsp. europaea TaxID=158383 RepID=A0A8S0R1B5_OLEEU|nr:Hypothetical predicted protein [Olea europaea subsp. europaea]